MNPLESPNDQTDTPKDNDIENMPASPSAGQTIQPAGTSPDTSTPEPAPTPSHDKGLSENKSSGEAADEPIGPVYPLQPKRSKLKTLLYILLALVILAGVGYAVYTIWKPAESNKSASSVTKKDIPKLSVGVINGAVSLYPPANADSYTQAVVAQMYESLVAYQDNTKIVPLLATGWSNPDSSTWDFDIRRNVTFHNGHKMTAEDVAYSLKYARDSKALNEIYSDTIKDAKALNDYKVEVTTTKPDPFFLNKLTFLMVLDSRDKDSKDASNGTGPYVIKPGTEMTDKNIKLAAYDKYHGGHVYVRELEFVAEADETALAADFKSGKINMAGEFSADSPSGLKGVNYSKIVVDDPAVTFMALNSVANGPLQKKEVREALRESIDAQQLIKDTGISAEPVSQLITQTIPGYNPSIPVPKRDVAKAKALLKTAGFANGVSLTLETSPSNQVLAEAVIKQAAEAGITITLKIEPAFEQLIGNMLDGKNQITIISFASDVLDGSDVFEQVIQGSENYKSATLDDYLKQTSDTLDQTKRLQILQKTSKYLYDDVAAIPLFNRHRIWVTDKQYAMQVDNLALAPGIYFWQVYAN